MLMPRRVEIVAYRLNARRKNGGIPQKLPVRRIWAHLTWRAKQSRLSEKGEVSHEKNIIDIDGPLLQRVRIDGPRSYPHGSGVDRSEPGPCARLSERAKIRRVLSGCERQIREWRLRVLQSARNTGVRSCRRPVLGAGR